MTTIFHRTNTIATIAIGLALLLWSVGLFAFPLSARAADLTGGDLIKGSGSAVYYYAADGTRYVFPNEKTYKSWYEDFSNVIEISDEELADIPLSGENITYRPGTYLVKITTDPKVYAVEPNGVLRWIETADLAEELYGSDWESLLHDLPDEFFANYTVGDSISEAVYPAGSLVSLADSDDVYYINSNGQKQLVTAMDENRFRSEFVRTASDLSAYEDGEEIAAADSDLIDASQGGGVGQVQAVGSELSVSLSSSSPASASIVADSTSSDGAQALVPFAAFDFTASSDGDVTVSALKLKRGGISSDSDLANVYLYDGDSRLATNTSISSGVISFTSGFTVEAGTTKTITVKADLANGVSASETISMSIDEADDITTDGASVSGDFPISGNTMTTATVSDLGKLDVDNVSPKSATTVDPGVTDRELWRFSLSSSDQNLYVYKLKMTMVGTITSGDLANFDLWYGGEQLGSTIASLSSDNTLEFDLSDSPLELNAGTTKNLSLKGDVVSGSSRNFYFSFQSMSDIVGYDRNYGVYIKPNQADTFSVVNSATTTINSGSLSITKASEPSGNVALNATNVTIAKFNVKATGEDVKVSSLSFTPTITGSKTLRNAKVYLDGTQIGSTASSITGGTAQSYSFGNSFIAIAGETHELTYVADIQEASGQTALEANDTITIQITSGTATGQSSLSSISVGTPTSNTLTIASGTASVAASAALSDASSSSPSGVAGTPNVIIGKFVITAGSGEGIEINQITLKSGSVDWGGEFDNIRVVPGGADVTDSANYIGNAVSSPSTTAGTTYSFVPSEPIAVSAGEQYTIDVYADLKSDATTTKTAFVGVVFADMSYQGTTTNTSSTYSGNDVDGQKVYISTGGTLTAAKDADTPISAYLVMGKTDQSIAKFRLTASADEDLTVTRIVVTDTTSAPGTLINLKLYDSNGTQIGSTVDSLSTTNANSGTAYADFSNLSLTVPKGSDVTVEVKADVNAYPNATSGSTHTLSLQHDYSTSSDTQAAITYMGSSGSVSSAPSSDVSANQMTVYRTGLTVSLSSSSPSGAQATNASHYVAYFNFTADSAYRVNLEHINVVLSGTALPSSGTVSLYLRDDSGRIDGASGTWTIGTSSQVALTPTTPIEISAGTTKTLIIETDTTGFQTGSSGSTKSFVVTLNKANGVNAWEWSDGVTSNIAPLSTEYPVYSNTLQF